MSFLKLLIRSFLHYRYSHLGTLLGTALAAAIIIAALTIGNSVQYSLQKIVKTRLGNTAFVITSNNRFFKTDLADRVVKKLQIKTAPVLQYKGMAISGGGEKKINNIQVYGIDKHFWETIGNNIIYENLKEDEVIINQKLASGLHVKANDEFILRFQKTGFVPMNTPFVPDDVNAISKRVKIKIITSENEYGNFNLQANQIVPDNVFISREYLSDLLLKGAYSNVILIAEKGTMTMEKVSVVLSETWNLDDINYKINKLPSAELFELNSNRVFIDEPVKKIILSDEKSAITVFTYFVNSIKKGSKETPYSFVSAPGITETESLLANEIILNEWTASDIAANVGDTIEMAYYTTGYLKELKEKTGKFIVKKIIPMSTAWADSTLIPGIEGLSDVEKCGDWKAGIPVNLKKIRSKDEAYWKQYKGTPKAYVSLKTAAFLWSTKYGNCTAIRFRTTVDTSSLLKSIIAKLKPEQFSINTFAVSDEGKWSAQNAVDFSGLFIGLSFFLLLAAIILISLLFSMHIDLRIKEQGILLALGIRKKFIKKLLFSEGVLVAFMGVGLGIVPGIFFSKLVFYFLNGIWSDIIRTTSIEVNVNLISIFTGCLISFFIALSTMVFVVWRKSMVSINNLHRKNIYWNVKKTDSKSTKSLLISIPILLFAILLLIFLNNENDSQNQSLFFLTGALFLTGSLFFANFILLKLNVAQEQKISIFALIICNLGVRKKSVISLLSILSIAVFLVTSVGLSRTDFSLNYANKRSGTGGYLLYGETTLPILKNLNLLETKKNYGITNLPPSIKFTQIKTLPGDDASCLNLNRAVRPKIIAVNPDEFAQRNAFSFAETLNNDKNKSPWNNLNDNLGENIIPAIADQTVIKWGLGKNIGDTLTYINEPGDKIHLKLVGGLESSIFQGNIIISEANFVQNFPSVSGSTIFLVDAKMSDLTKCKDILLDAFQAHGISVIQTSEQLQMFNSVTNTYLDIFLSLGGIALIIGIIGIAVVIIKNVAVQKHEFAMMQAMGLSRKLLFQIILKENLIVVFGGLFIGLFAALFSVFPSLRNSNQIAFVAVFLLIFLVNAIVWIVIAENKSLKKDFLFDLRNE